MSYSLTQSLRKHTISLDLAKVLHGRISEHSQQAQLKVGLNDTNCCCETSLPHSSYAPLLFYSVVGGGQGVVTAGPGLVCFEWVFPRCWGIGDGFKA